MCSGPILAGVGMFQELLSAQATNQLVAAQAQSISAAAVAQTQATYQAIQERQQEEQRVEAIEVTRRIRQGMRERATLRATQAEGMLGGATMSRDMIASLILQDEEIGLIREDTDFSMAQLEREKRAASASGQSELNRARGIASQTVGGLPLAFRVASAGVSGWSRGKAMEAPFKTSKLGPIPNKRR